MTLDLDALEALGEAATPGPWGITTLINPSEYVVSDATGNPPYVVGKGTGDDTAFITAARNALPALLRRARLLDEALALLGPTGPVAAYMRETRPIEGHSDPGALEDCKQEVIDLIARIEAEVGP